MAIDKMKVLKDLAESEDGETWVSFDHERRHTLEELARDGLVRQLPRGASPYHDGYKITRKGRKAIVP